MSDSQFYKNFRREIWSKRNDEVSSEQYTPTCTRSHKWQWYDPPQNSGFVQFVQDTSLHCLHYLGQQHRHLFERVFWFIAFSGAVITSSTLIWEMWAEYMDSPIVTVFTPNEVSIEQIPFPAVTICSVNNIKKSKWKQYEQEALQGLRGELPKEIMLQRLANILDVNHICYSAKSFTQKFYDTPTEENELMEGMRKYQAEYVNLSDTTATLRDGSQSCRDMILFCLWLDNVHNCSDLFYKIETDYGYCCTFNMIPMPLLRRFENYIPESDITRVNDWAKENLTNKNIWLKDSKQQRKYPYRQVYAGRSAGLSFLVDPNMEEYHCIDTDSEGFMLGLNLPLDVPRMKDSGIAVRTSTETFVSLRPDITLSAESVRKAKLHKRNCYLDGEKRLQHYTKYTATNCLDECIANKTLEACGCVRYYMPHFSASSDVEICTPQKYDCTELVKGKIVQGGLAGTCDDCLPACTEIQYQTVESSLRIQEDKINDLFKYRNISISPGRARNMSIIHVYFNVDSAFPRLRKEAATTIDLISSAGGLLGLCMGCSMLSLLEILYHMTLRLLCNFYRERSENDESIEIIYPRVFSKTTNRVEPRFTNQDPLFTSRGYIK